MKKILIVEDVEMNVELLVQLLEDDYDLVVATDGGEGVAKATAERPDLILMDMSLPVIDGYEATRRIRGNPELDQRHHHRPLCPRHERGRSQGAGRRL